MNEKVICEKCGCEMTSFIRGSNCGMECPGCGWGWVTTYIAPVDRDSQEYSLIIQQCDKPEISLIKAAAGVLNCNYLTARKKVIESDIIITGSAKETLKNALILKSHGIKYSIEPDFPHKIE